MRRNELKGVSIKPIPDTFKDIQELEMKVIKRGQVSYILHNPTKGNYRVMERIIKLCSDGFQEILENYQRYERFETLEEAERHFELYESGELEDIMFYVK